MEHSVFSRWAEFAMERKRLRHDEEVKNRKIKKAALKWKQMELHAVFNTWHKNVKNIVRERKLVERFKSRYTHRIEHSVFSRWHEFTVDKKKNRKLVEQFARKWRNMDSFTRFTDGSNLQKTLNVKGRKVKHVIIRFVVLH